MIVYNLKQLLAFCNLMYHLMCYDPSHGGFYMAEGAFYIRIGLLPRVVSGDRLALSRRELIDRYLHCRRAYPMSRD